LLPLSTILNDLDIDKVKSNLKSFQCQNDNDIQDFLINKSIEFEKRRKSRTYLLINNNFEILAYFTLALKVLKLSDNISKSSRKKLDGFKNDIKEIPYYLIGQLERNDNFTNNTISGKTILSYAIRIIRQSYEQIGGKIVLVECNDNHKVIPFYLNNGFKLLQKDELVQLILHL